jgi:hypothetical protein
MSSIKIWGKVPDGAKLSVWVVPKAGTFTCGARLRRGNGTEEEWVQSQLVPGPKNTTVRSPEVYVVTALVAFTGSGTNTAEINATVTKPDGSQHGSAYAYEVSGTRGEFARATILVQTVKA